MSAPIKRLATAGTAVVCHQSPLFQPDGRLDLTGIFALDCHGSNCALVSDF